MKVIPVRELVQKGASGVIAGAENEPVLITRNGEPAAWVIGSKWMAEAGRDGADLYEQALISLAVGLFDQEVLSTGQATRLSGLPMVDFITTAGRLGVPVMRLPPGGLAPEIEALERALAASEASAPQSTEPLPRVEVQALGRGGTSDADLYFEPEDTLVPA